MDFASLIQFALQLSIIFTVFAGFDSTSDDALFLFRRPSLLARSLLSMNIVMPVFAVFVIKLFNYGITGDSAYNSSQPL
jgi:BASS family bile acid:Na+ symporter